MPSKRTTATISPPAMSSSTAGLLGAGGGCAAAAGSRGEIRTRITLRPCSATGWERGEVGLGDWGVGYRAASGPARRSF